VHTEKIDLSHKEVKQKVRTAIELLIKKDARLLKIDINERSITHKLALYLQDSFKGWDVDCEYNRNRYDTKRLSIGGDVRLTVETTQTNDEQGKTAYPDIIVQNLGSGLTY